MIVAPFTVAIDTREQCPWRFQSITVSHRRVQTPVRIQTERKTLHQGDYSIVGLEDQIAVERKSIPDACASFLRGRKRFIRELERLDVYKFSVIIVEGSWEGMLAHAEIETQALPASLDSSILGMMLKYQTHWIFRPGRLTAEKTCFKLFDLFYRYEERGRK